MNLNRYIDHTLLAPQAYLKDIENLCREAREYGFYSVMVNPAYVSRAAQILEGSDIKVGSVIGFPLGANRTDIKIAEAMAAENDGADEIDIVANIGALMAGEFSVASDEFIRVKKAVSPSMITKVIIETPLLGTDMLPEAVQAVIDSGADFVKSATGFFGATPVEHILQMSNCSQGRIKVKAAGGIKTAEEAMAMIEAGAARIGCSSSVPIIIDFEKSHKK
ncbi:MAG: deoxyribose-phosphate aldolase [FCB group bacterium]|nr:deoxyribose-phosphate aldolase [FCB group bacterium]